MRCVSNVAWIRRKQSKFNHHFHLAGGAAGDVDIASRCRGEDEDGNMWPLHWRPKSGSGRRPWRNKSPASQDEPSPSSASSPASPANPARLASDDAIEISIDQGANRQSLWDRAYDSLRTQDRQLVEDYEKLLSAELNSTDEPSLSDAASSTTVTGTGTGTGIGIHRPRHEHLNLIIDRSLHQLDDKKTKYTIAGHEFVVRDHISRAADLVLWAREWIAVAVKASPEASIAWAGISIILPLLTNPATAQEANHDGFTYVTTRMRYYAALETELLRRLGDNKGVDDGVMSQIAAHIVTLYQHILDFQIRSVLRFHQGRLKRLGRDMVRLDNWEAKRKKILELEAVVDRAVGAVNAFASRQELESLEVTSRHSFAHLEQLLSTHEEHLQVAQQQLKLQELAIKRSLSDKEQQCHQLFRLTERNKDVSYEWYKKRVDDRVEGTCQWFLQHDHFNRWLEQDSGPLLVSADPGCGKSVLAKHLIDHVLPRSASICYFFFRDRDQYTLRQALCALLHQLFLQRPFLIQHAMPAFTSDGRALAANTMAMWSILESAVRDPEAGPIIMVLDALDECRKSDFLNLAGMLKQLHRDEDGSTSVKSLMTCRPYEQVVSEFRDLLDDFPFIRIPGEEESETISREVDLVITHRVRQLAVEKQLSEAVEEHLSRRLRQIPHRTYLWVHLVFDHLKTSDFKRTAKGVESMIASLPENVNQAYERILNRSGEKERPMVRKAFRIILAAYEPLTLSQMNIAMNIDESLQDMEDLDLEDEHHFRARLRSWCGLFITVYQGKVHFIHQTAREFLIAAILPSESRPRSLRWQHSITARNAHRVLAGVCVTYLKVYNDRATAVRGSDGKQGRRLAAMLAYSAGYCMDHLRDAAVTHDDDILDTAMGLYEKGSRIRSAWQSNFRNSSEYVHLTALAMATCFGHTAVVARLLDEGVDANDPQRWKWQPSALHLAIDRGRRTIVKLLLEKGATVDYAVFHLAAQRGCEKTVQLLLDKIPAGETQGGFLGIPLARSAELGHEAVVKILLNSGADVGVRDRGGKTPLHLASLSGHAAIVRHLLNKGAVIDAKDDMDDTPLLCVIGKSYQDDPEQHEEVVRLLLSRGADFDVKSTGQGWTPLSLASAMGHTNTARLLLDSGADPEGKGLGDRTALSWAATGRSGYEVVELLVDAGAAVDTRDEEGRAPLHFAIEAAKFDVVELLLDRGADVEIKDNNGQTPLHSAASSGQYDVVKLLLDRGARRDVVDEQGRTPLSIAEDEARFFPDDVEEELEDVVGLLRGSIAQLEPELEPELVVLETGT